MITEDHFIHHLNLSFSGCCLKSCFNFRALLALGLLISGHNEALDEISMIRTARKGILILAPCHSPPLLVASHQMHGGHLYG